MTILPKKKSSQSRSESESTTDGTSLQHLSVGNNSHLSHIGPVTQVMKAQNKKETKIFGLEMFLSP